MNTVQFLTTTWTWSPLLLLICGASLAGYLAAFGWTRRVGFFLAALGVFFITLASPLNALADGYLFSAHMVQHILLLLIVPALVIRSLPRDFELWIPVRRIMNPLVGWICGLGAMWLWHAPALCNAAAASSAVSTVQTVSLLAMGTAFWWQVLAPREGQRLTPLPAVIYLFSACLGCTALGIVLTFAPVTVCSVYMHPADRLGMLGTIRGQWGMSAARDQQIGGLLMWVPMCMIYLSAIFAQLARWYAPAPARAAATINAGEH